MKKVLVLGVLFALPITVYILFATAVNNFAHLPTLTKNISGLENFKSLDGNELHLDDQITVLSIYGESITKMEGNAFNLNEKIYKKNYNFKDFQFIVLAENGTQDEARDLLDQLSTTTDTDTQKWKFAFGSLADIQDFFDSMKTTIQLNQNKATPFVFIIDKERNLRGRDKADKSVTENKYGYDTRSVAELNNIMDDDVKVILAEYRLALKKYNKKKETK